MAYLRVCLCSLLVASFGLGSATAQAAMLFSDTVLIKGPEYLTVLELPLDAVGSYKVTATDLNWFKTPLQALSFAVFTATESLKTKQGPGALEFFSAGKDKVFLQLYAKSSGPKFAGLVSLQVENQAPVPLPPSLLLLGSVLGAGVLARGVARLRAHGRRVRAASASVVDAVRALVRVSRRDRFTARGQLA